MANISSAHGNYIFEVNTENQIKAVAYLLKNFFINLTNGQYDTELYDLNIYNDNIDQIEDHIRNNMYNQDDKTYFNAQFYGNGRWSYSNNLCQFEAWSGLAEKNQKNTVEFYKLLDNETLIIECHFNDYESGMGVFYESVVEINITKNTVTVTEVSSDNIELSLKNLLEYNQVSDEDFIDVTSQKNFVNDVVMNFKDQIKELIKNKNILTFAFIETLYEYIQNDEEGVSDILQLNNTAIDVHEMPDLINTFAKRIL